MTSNSCSNATKLDFFDFWLDFPITLFCVTTSWFFAGGWRQRYLPFMPLNVQFTGKAMFYVKRTSIFQEFGFLVSRRTIPVLWCCCGRDARVLRSPYRSLRHPVCTGIPVGQKITIIFHITNKLFLINKCVSLQKNMKAADFFLRHIMNIREDAAI